MIEQLKILIVINTLLAILGIFTKKRILNYLLPFVLVSVPLIEFIYTPQNISNFIYIKLLMIFVVLKQFRDINNKIHSFSNAGILNNIILLVYLGFFTEEILLKYLIILSVSLLGVSLVSKNKNETIALHLFNIFIAMTFIFTNYKITHDYIYIIYFLFTVINIFFLIIWIPFSLLKKECVDKKSYYLYAYLALLISNVKIISPKLEILMYQMQPINKIAIFLMPLISILIFIYWITNFYLINDNLKEKVFSLYMSQLALGFFLGFSFKENISEIIIAYIALVSIFYMLLRESLEQNSISDLFLFILAISGLVAFPITNLFYLKLEYINFINNKLSWFSIFSFIIASVYIYNTLIYFYESFKDSYINHGIKLKKIELTIFTIVIFFLPRYII